MSVLRPGDEPMHYPDGSHRWVSPYGSADQRAWEESVRQHQLQHRERLGGAAVRPPRPRSGRAEQLRE